MSVSEKINYRSGSNIDKANFYCAYSHLHCVLVSFSSTSLLYREVLRFVDQFKALCFMGTTAGCKAHMNQNAWWPITIPSSYYPFFLYGHTIVVISHLPYRKIPNSTISEMAYPLLGLFFFLLARDQLSAWNVNTGVQTVFWGYHTLYYSS